MIHCIECGATHWSPLPFCTTCGAPLACPKCGAVRSKKGQNFCLNDGHRFIEKPDAPARSPSTPPRKRRRVVLAGLGIGILLICAAYFRHHRRYNQKPFPNCPRTSGNTHRWGRVTFTVPQGWTAHDMKPLPEVPARKAIMLRRGEEFRHYERAIGIAEDPSEEFRDEFNKGLEGRGDQIISAVPGTAQTLEISGRKAVLYLGRTQWQHWQQESWDLLIDGGDTIIQVGGPDLMRGYHHLPETCDYWTVVRSLRID